MHAPLPKLPARMPAERSRSRRERRSDAARRPVVHIIMPGIEVAREVPRRNETITAFLRRTGWAWRDREYGWQFRKGLPTILEVNGQPLLRRDWARKKIAANDNLRFVSHPLGGGNNQGKQVIGLVALVALAAFSGGIASAILGPTLAGTTLVGSLTYGTALSSAIMFGGALLINALVAPKAGATNDPNATTDQIYSVQAQGNTAKLGQPLPVRYGREKVFPDFAATPWSEYVGNDQYLNILLSQGMGSFSYEQLFMSDTPLWNPTDGVLPSFSSAQVRFYEPGQNIDLFPINVVQSDEVTGQQLPDGTGLLENNPGEYGDGLPITPGAWLGPFVANPAGTKAYKIAVDYVFPSGSFVTYGQQGLTGDCAAGLTAEARQVNDAGAPIGDFFTLVTQVTDYATKSPIRGTLIADLPSDGRYEVRFRRNEGVPKDNKGASEAIWAGLRAFLRGNSSFADVSTIAIRIKASESTQGSYKFGVLATRKLPVWNGSTFVTQATRNPFWAFLDSVTNAQYGSSHPISKVDFNAVVNAAAAADTRGDHFDYSFTSAVSCPEAWDKILTPARSRHFWLGDTISIVRDEWRDVPSMMLTDREIVRGSTQVTWTMLGDDDPDAVVIEYVDEDVWRPAQVQYPPDTELFTATNPETKRIDGIVNRDHAYRECAFYYLQSIYRRENVSIGTEYEGRAITFGSALRVQSELPQAYGYGGAVMASTGTGGRTLTLSPAPVWTGASTFIRLRRPNGKWFGPVAVTKGADDSQALLDVTDLATVQTQQGTTLAAVLLREDGADYPSFELGTADNQSKLCVVMSGQPNGDLCTLNLVVDDQRVHATDLGSPPILPVGQFPSNSKSPLIIGLNAKFDQGVAEPILRASWFPAPGALYYIADVSYDAGNSWISVYEGADNSFEKFVTLGALTLRVQAVGSIRGPYASVEVEAPTIVVSDSAVQLKSLDDVIKEKITTAMADITKILADSRDFLDTITADTASQNWLDKDSTQSQLTAVNGLLSASISIVQTVAVSTQQALADYKLVVATNFDGVNAAVTSEQIARSSADAAMAANITTLNSNLGTTNANLTAEAGTRASADSALSTSLTTLSTTVGSHTSSISTISSSVNGISLQYGVVGTIDGVSGAFIFSGVKKLDGTVSYNVAINGGLIVSGTILAGALNVPYLSAVSADIGTVTSGTIIISD